MSDSDLDLDDDEEQQQPEDQERMQHFQLATTHVMGKANIYDSKDLLELYGLYKQATEGVCNTPRPTVLQLKARSKWNAWHDLGEMSQKDAQLAYVNKLNKLDPNWLEESRKNQTGGGRLSGWVVHSIESKPIEDQSRPDHMKTIFDHVKENNLQRLREQLKPSDLTPLDEQGMALLHWATDRNAIEIIEYLIKCGANVNQLDAEQQTPLHYAASCGHVEALRYLLKLNADLELRDSDGQTCLDVADDEQICAMLQAELQLRKIQT